MEPAGPPLLPQRRRRLRYPGRLPVDDRATLEGILWVLRNDVRWRRLPTGLFGVSGVTCWRRLRDWTEAGVWQRLHETLLAECNAAGRLDPHRALVDSSHIHALHAGAQTGPSPVNRGHPGSKHHVITDATGVPLAAVVAGGNRHPAHPPDRGHPTDPRPSWPATAPPPLPARRPGLRPPQPPTPAQPPPDHPDHRPLRASSRLRSGHPALARGTHHRLAAPVPPATHPLGTARRPPPGIPHPRLLDHLPTETPRIILKPGLSGGGRWLADGTRRGKIGGPTPSCG
ncbi:hypothetical protein FRACA_880010 [Frankia canadensis]|uniref:Insertion element IS402-like domain-containing protein n=1 Tax=Frankia canadensis TaxID=1836972 RepID=A0A2I2L223_9ACTN|nr:hypothetical protein FRACA_880010 [Frankia canadensis]SOU59249.1 hypothetical protein FRACA_880010 [Frankia canadensis]